MWKPSLVRLLPSFAVAGVAVAAALSGASALSAWRDAAAPHIGDMISFRAGGTGQPGKRVTVVRQKGGTCVLDLGVLHGSGGSFIVEGPAPDERFLLHWAGPRTERGAANCGASAEIILTVRQIEVLGVAAYAFGLPLEAGA